MQITELASALDDAIKKKDEAESEFATAKYEYLKAIGMNAWSVVKLASD